MKNHVANGFDHASPETIGVLLTNLGTPDQPDKKSVRKFLKEFLWDRRVVEAPRLAWWLVLNFIILNTRPARSSKAYQKVWTGQGSPLMTISKELHEALRTALEGSGKVIALGMRYGSPSLADGLETLREQRASRILVLPLYPQYSATTTATTFDAVAEELRGWRRIPEMRFVNHYHDHPKYIDALCQSIQIHWSQHGQAEKLLMSFHGIPRDYFEKGDHYHCECHKTGRLVAEQLGLQQDQWALTFQSRLGPKKWLQPYTDKTIGQLAKSGARSLQVICPGFSVDCLETLEEVAMENKDIYMEHGGERYQYIPCLNASSQHVEMMLSLINTHTGGWASSSDDLSLRKQRAIELGAAG